MKLLAIETATEGCSVALLCDGDLRERFEVAPRRHAELLLPWIDELLADAGVARSALDAIAVSRGPGAFTGVRLGIAVAQGIGYALDRPLLPVSTLAALAGGAGSPVGARVLTAIDARMGELYVAAWCIGPNDEPEALGEEQLCAAHAVPGLLDGVTSVAPAGWYGIGSGFAAAEGALSHLLAGRLACHDAAALPRAATVARLAAPAYGRGEAIAPAAIEPAYLRDKVAQTLAERAG